MSKKRLVGIVVGCIAVAIAVIVIAIGLPEGTREPEQIQVSAHDLATDLLVEFTGARREELWEKCEGRQVRWTNELMSIWEEEGSLVVYFLNPLDAGRTTVRAVFDESQRSSLSEISEGDLVVYTGVLTSYGEGGVLEIHLRDCAVVSVITPTLLWWNSELNATYTTLATIDGGHLWVMVLRSPRMYWDKGYVTGEYSWMALNIQSGEVAYEEYAGHESLYIRDLRHKSPDYEGIAYESVHCASHTDRATRCTTLKAIDRKTGSVLWMRTLHTYPIYDFFVAHGVLFISNAAGVGAFELPTPTELQNPKS